MSFLFNKSSLLASIEIINDKNFKKYKNLTYLESQKTTLDIKNGRKIIDILGTKLLKKYNDFSNYRERKYILREILALYLKKAKPGFMFRITGGRLYFLEFVSENFEQLLKEAGLLDKIDFTVEGSKIRNWWDDLSEFIRKLDKSAKLDLGRAGEEKTIRFEEKKLRKLKISKKPSWDGFENNLLGYDIQSWRTNSKKIYIEVKASSYSNGTFFLTRNEWNFSISVKDDFMIHLWIQDNSRPRIITFQELHSKNYKIEDVSNAEWSKIKIVPVKIN